jgi:D-alanyl-lipoteichoic acid acyltransferase DltB (MBOAT superfamily)
MSLLDDKFLLLSLLAIVMLTGLRGLARHAVFAAANLVFLVLLLRPAGPRGLVALAVPVAFCLLGYGLTRLTLRHPRFGLRASISLTLVLFIYLRNYGFLEWVLPGTVLLNAVSTVGLSFLFFRIVHVLIDAASGTLRDLDPFTYVNYCLNFTTYMMGPIQRYPDFIAQWKGQNDAIPLDFESHLNAALRVLLGLFKAYVVADLIEPYALSERMDLAAMSRTQLLLSIYVFYVYLYFNFSGYCDIVIGIGSLFGIRPPENFDKPFLSRNVSEFWLRMHRSLTTWLTDYVFSPLFKRALTGGWLASRPLLAANLAVLATMVIAGVWHGTTFSFLIFGIIHGLYQVAYRTWDAAAAARFGRARVREWRRRPVIQAGAVFLTFNAVSLAFIFFSLDTPHAMLFISRLVHG